MNERLSTPICESRSRLFPRLREHAERLSRSFGLIDPRHREAGSILAGWIAANYQPGAPLQIIVVCTGNSRRSILGSSMGNLASAFHGLPEIRFHSGGTAPTAFNSRTADALKAIGFEIEATGDEASRGEPETRNPIYRVSWGAGFEAREFSKHYADSSNPNEGFASLMVCDEADAGCPRMPGARLRISIPYEDPKAFDGQTREAEKYAGCRDDIGRLMLSVIAASGCSKSMINSRTEPTR